MRGHVDPQASMYSYFSVEERIPTDHALRRIKAQADTVPSAMAAAFKRAQSKIEGLRLLV